MADKENDMFKAMDAKGNGDLQNWAERYYAKMVEEKQVEKAPSMMDQLLEKAGNWVDQKIEELPAEEQEAAEMTEKACDSIIDSLDELEKWIDKW